MAKAEKPTPAATEGAATASAAKPKNKKKLLLIAVGVLLLVGSGAGWYFTKGSHHAEAVKAPPPAPPKFLALEPFTVNLQSNGSDQFLQIGITLKFVEPELEEKIKLHMPEIRSHLLFLLSSKHASELTTVEGKKNLAKEIIAETSAVLGLRIASVVGTASVVGAPSVVSAASAVNATSAVNAASAVEAASAMEAASAVEAASEVEAAPAEAASAPDTTAPAAVHSDKDSSGIVDVLFTSFIIQ